jgi:glutathione synthase/RimK-type ligase-like ATP-grasp enzyme
MMKVLILTNKSDLTSDFIVKKLKERNISFYRFNTEELTKSISISLNFQTDLFQLFDSNSEEIINLKEFSSIYFRRPELPAVDIKNLSIGEVNFLKSEIMFTLEGIYKILRNAYWVSPLYSIRESENKIYQLEIAKSLGFNIPDSLISNLYEQTEVFFNRNMSKCILKPIKSGLIDDKEEPKIVFTNIIEKLPKDKSKIERFPVYFQNCIEKKGDIRVIMVGENVFATLIHSQDYENTQIDWRKGEITLNHTKFELPSDLINKCISLLKVLKLRFGAIDFVLDKYDKLIFLEINPNGQWAWIEKQTGYKISNEIVNLLQYENF